MKKVISDMSKEDIPEGKRVHLALELASEEIGAECNLGYVKSIDLSLDELPDEIVSLLME